MSCGQGRGSAAAQCFLGIICTISSDLRQILQAKNPSDASRSIRWSSRMGQNMGQTSHRIMEAALAVAAQRYRAMPCGSNQQNEMIHSILSKRSIIVAYRLQVIHIPFGQPYISAWLPHLLTWIPKIPCLNKQISCLFLIYLPEGFVSAEPVAAELFQFCQQVISI